MQREKAKSEEGRPSRFGGPASLRVRGGLARMQPDSSLFHVESCTVGYGPRRISVKLRQALDPDYGLFVWPSAHVLAHYLWKENYSSSPLSGCNILEVAALFFTAGESFLPIRVRKFYHYL